MSFDWTAFQNWKMKYPAMISNSKGKKIKPFILKKVARERKNELKRIFLLYIVFFKNFIRKKHPINTKSVNIISVPNSWPLLKIIKSVATGISTINPANFPNKLVPIRSETINKIVAKAGPK